MAKNMKHMLKYETYVKILQDILFNLKIIQTYFRTLEEVPWLLTLKKSKKPKKILKKASFITKIAKICEIKI